MSPERLLEHYHRIADAEDAVPRLRRFVLNLAVRGKLVEQNPADEPAAALLKRIAVEKARLVKAGKIGKQSSFTSIKPDEQPFSIPRSWAWVTATYPAYGVSDLGKKIKTTDVLETGKYPVVDQGKVMVRGFCDDTEKVIKVERPLIVFGDHTRETKLIDFDFVVGADGVKLLRPIVVDEKFYFLVLRWLPLESRGYGRHFKMLKASVLPLPPLAEQHRIVAKVDELMALCDQLETARREREATRDRLTAASLARLTAPETEQKDFHTCFDMLVALTTRPDQIEALRQTILNLAVRGKLVEQNPADEPASKLLKLIKAEKKRLMKEGFIKKSKTLPKVTEDDAPFDLPDGWMWSRIGEICSKTGSGSTPRGGKEVYKKAGVSFLRSQNVYNDGLRLKGVAFIDPLVHMRMKETRVFSGDLLLNITGGSMGRCGLVHADCGEANISQHISIIRPAVRGIEGFLHRLILSPYFQAFIFGEQTGAGRGGLPKNRMDKIAVALPPLAEQHRIVAKVNELIALCDQLETALSTASNTRTRLLESLLYEALAAREEMKEAA